MHQRAATIDASMVVHTLEVVFFQTATAKILITATVVKPVSSLFIQCLVYFCFYNSSLILSCRNQVPRS